MQQINFNGLAKAGAEKTPKSGTKSSILGISIVLGFIPLMIVLFIFFSMFPAFSAVLIIVAMIAIVVYASKKSKEFDKSVKSFAADNGWAAGSESPVVSIMARKGYKSGNSQINGTLDGMNFWFYLCEPPVFRSRENKNSTSLYMLTFEFPKEMPEMLIVPASGALKLLADSVFKYEYGLERINLEGDFGNRIQVYMVPGQHIPVLEYVTPDVMDTLMNHLENFLVYSGRYVSVCTAKSPLDGKDVKQMFEEAQVVIKEIKEKQHL